MSLAPNSSARQQSATRDTIRCVVDGQPIRVDPGGSSAFEQIDDPPRAYQNTPTAGRITGFGDEYAGCGDQQPHFCSECGKPARDDDGDLVTIGETCWRQECPRCGAGWSMRRAVPIVAKMESLRKEIAARRDGNSPLFHHCAIPMQNFRSSRDPDDTFFQVVKAALDEVGVNVFGGALIHHPYTGNQDDDDDLDQWKERLFAGREWEGDVEDELEEWHHVHALVLADEIQHLSCEALHDKTNILVHRIEKEDEDTNVSLYGVEDLAEATTYALSHAREAAEADAYRYFGEVANHSADHRIEARCREVVRSVVPRTLDLQPAGYLCDREIGIDQVDRLPNIDRFNNDASSDSEQSETDETTEEDADQDDPEEPSEDDSAEATEPDDEETESEPGTDDADGTLSDEESETDSDTHDKQNAAEGTDTGGCGVHCNGRLIPFQYAPDFLDDDDRELEHADELRAAYAGYQPPPDDADVTGYGGAD